MTTQETQPLLRRDGADDSGAPPRRVLVVDDSRMQRRILGASLARWGYAVDEAASGTEALERLRARHFDFVISDWMMPGMNGPDLCRAFRQLPHEDYGYFILLTAKSDKGEVALGLDAGADDFLAKPVSGPELQARMNAGERILRMQGELTEKNRLLGDTLAEIRQLYAALDRDLVEARALQMTLVRDRRIDFGSAEIAFLLRPSGHVGGDLVGCFALPRGRVAFYAIDVSGHGVASAMLAARLAGILGASAPEGNVALQFGRGAKVEPRPPDQVVAGLNRAMLESMEVDQYFTCVFAVADLASGEVSLVQAGHPHPLVLRAGGKVERLGQGGLPVGLLAEAAYECLNVRLSPGDRLLFVSDGLTEAASPTGAELGQEGVERMVACRQALDSPALLEALLQDVQGFAAEADLNDDVSAVIYEFRGHDVVSEK